MQDAGYTKKTTGNVMHYFLMVLSLDMKCNFEFNPHTCFPCGISMCPCYTLFRRNRKWVYDDLMIGLTRAFENLHIGRLSYVSFATWCRPHLLYMDNCTTCGCARSQIILRLYSQILIFPLLYSSINAIFVKSIQTIHSLYYTKT